MRGLFDCTPFMPVGCFALLNMTNEVNGVDCFIILGTTTIRPFPTATDRNVLARFSIPHIYNERKMRCAQPLFVRLCPVGNPSEELSFFCPTKHRRYPEHSEGSHRLLRGTFDWTPSMSVGCFALLNMTNTVNGIDCFITPSIFCLPDVSMRSRIIY